MTSSALPRRSRDDRLMRAAQLLTVMAVAVAIVLLSKGSDVSSGAYVPSGRVSPHVWDPGPPSGGPKYVNGNPKGYTEGETTAMSVHIGNVAGQTYDVDLCLEVLKNDDYGFSGIDPWNRNVNVSYLPTANGGVGPTVDYTDGTWDLGDTNVWGRYIAINSVSAATKGQGLCDDSYYVGVSVNFTVATGQSDAWIVFGGRLAIPGAALPSGFADSTVPVGHGASNVDGTFQSRIAGAGDKTINFSGGDTAAGPADIGVTVSCPDFYAPAPYTYTSTVSNNGDNVATGVELVVTLPTGVTYDTYASSPSGSCSASGQVVTCNLSGNLSNAATWTVEIDVTLQSPPGTNLSVQADASANEPDDNAVNDADTCATTTAVSLAFVSTSATADAVTVQWSTVTEAGNIGFNVYAVTADGRVRLNRDLVPSNTVDSVVPQHYVFTGAAVDARSFYIEDVDRFGSTGIHGPFELGAAVGERPDVAPIDVATVVREHETKATERLGVLLEAARGWSGIPPSPVSVIEDGVSTTAARAAAGADKQVPAPLLLRVDEDGLYRVTAQDLLAVGFDWSGMAASHLALTSGGVPVPVFVGGAARLLGPSSYFEFVGRAQDSLYTRTNVYVLSFDAKHARRVLTRDARSSGTAPDTTYRNELTVERDRAYSRSAPGNDPWYDTSMLTFTSPRSWTLPFQVADVMPGAPSELEVSLWGVTDWPSAPDHHVVASVNDVTVGEAWFDGMELVSLRVTLPDGLVHEGANKLELTMPGDSGQQFDMVQLDGFRVVHERRLVAAGDDFSFEIASGNDALVKGLLSPNLVLYRTDGDVPTRLTGFSVWPDGGLFSTAFAGSGEPSVYMLVADQGMLKPVIEPMRAPVDITSGSADLLVISHPDFLADLGPLVDARRSQGRTVKVADLEDVYAQFGHHIAGPDAVHDYIKYAAKRMHTGYVLLVGGDTYDPLDNLGFGGVSFVPTPYAATDRIVRFAPADALLVDLDGDDVPDLPIGRLPVRTSTELRTLVDKILAYDEKDYGGTAVFAADSFDGSVSYALESDGIIEQLPNRWQVNRAYVDDLGTAGAKSVLIDEINDGVALTSYVGHSSYSVWSFSRLFTAADAGQLTNVRRPTAVVQWGCWNTYFVHPQYNTMAHSFLLSGDRGAAIVAGAATLTLASSERQLADRFVQLAVQPGMAIGDAMLQAKRQLAAENQDGRDVILGWALLGDPTQVIQE